MIDCAGSIQRDDRYSDSEENTGRIDVASIELDIILLFIKTEYELRFLFAHVVIASVVREQLPQNSRTLLFEICQIRHRHVVKDF